MTAADTIRAEIETRKREIEGLETALAILEGKPATPANVVPAPKVHAPRPAGTGAGKETAKDRCLKALADGPLSLNQIAEKLGVTPPCVCVAFRDETKLVKRPPEGTRGQPWSLTPAGVEYVRSLR